MPYSSAELARVKPVYEEMDGWLCETSNVTRIEDLPPKAKAYVDRLVELSGAKLGILSGHNISLGIHISLCHLI